jgi:hypothetical protein
MRIVVRRLLARPIVLPDDGWAVADVAAVEQPHGRFAMDAGLCWKSDRSESDGFRHM